MKCLKMILFVTSYIFITSCNQTKEDKKSDYLTSEEVNNSKEFDSISNGLSNNASFKQLTLSPNSVLLTGIDAIRLLPIYKIKPKSDRHLDFEESTSYYNSYEEDDTQNYHYFMPGMDIIHGYSMVNVAHYNIKTQKLSYFFKKPVLVKTLYFPGFNKDSLNGNPIKRNFFLASVYDEDTNKDTLINKRDLRRIYLFDAENTNKIQIIPKEFSAVRSTYDSNNDIMYIYTRYDGNKNGTPDKNEPMHIFWFDLKNPTIAKRLY